MNVLRILIFMRFLLWRHGCATLLPTPRPLFYSYLCAFLWLSSLNISRFYAFSFAFSYSLSLPHLPVLFMLHAFNFCFGFCPTTNPHPLSICPLPPAPCFRCQFPLELILCLNLRIVVLPPSSLLQSNPAPGVEQVNPCGYHPPPTLVKFNKGRAFVSPFWWWLPWSWIVLAGTHRVRQKPPAAFLYAPIIQSPIELQQQRLPPKVNAQKRSRRNDNQQ